jgi:alpha-amylase
MEMGEWTQIGAENDETAAPGFWRNFFHKYPESYAIHRRMLGVSELLERARGECDQTTQLEQAADDLGRAQCNCAYWHGVFGGLYLNYLRHALSYHTLKAEQRILRNCAGIAPDTVTLSDHDGTGREQVLLRSEELFAITDPANGMALTRLDHLPGYFCWSDVLARRTEAYHTDVAGAQLDTGEEHGSIHDVVLTKELGLERYLVPDPHPRASFVTFFSQLQSPEEILSTSQQGIAEWDWQLRDYGRPVSQLKTKDTGAHGFVDVGPYTLKKSVKLRGEGLKFKVALAAGVIPADAGDFFVEFNFTLLTDQAEDRYLDIDGNHHPVNAVGSFDTPELVSLADGWQQRKLSLRVEQLKQLLYYPVYAVSSSEGGFEKTYQGSCLLFRFDPQALKSGITICLNIDSLTGAKSNG